MKHPHLSQLYALLLNEEHDLLRDPLIRMCIELRPSVTPPAVIRTGTTPEFVQLVNAWQPRSPSPLDCRGWSGQD